MFRKSVLKAVTLATMSISVVALGANAASAGNYGYGKHYGKSHGYAKVKPVRPFGHIRDRVWKQHVDWCYGRFKTYNAYDNTYQPYGGPRQQCWSPYITG